MSSVSFSHHRGPGSSRIHQLLGAGSASRLRSTSIKKPPEPLRRAIADCLSPSASVVSHHGGAPCMGATEASRILRDYLASSATTDLTYIVIIEHTIAERERSPAVVARSVALIKRYLLRYKPSEETLLQIDQFCVGIIVECHISQNRKVLAQSLASIQQPSSLLVANFASGALVKSLNYVRSLVARYIPRRSFQSAAFAGATPATRQLLPSLSSLLSKSFNSQLNPVKAVESSENKVSTNPEDTKLTNIEHDKPRGSEYIASDVLKWRWLDENQFSSVSYERYTTDHAKNLPGSRHNFVEVGAAGLLVGDMEAKMNGQPWKYFGTADVPYLDQLLQPASVETFTNSACASPHLRTITASKRKKAGPKKIWNNVAVNTFRPRPRPLFQYRHYSEQQPLRLNSSEVCEVIAAVSSNTSTSSDTTTNPHLIRASSQSTNSNGRPSMDVAVSVLTKLVIDMYVMDSRIAAPLTLSMLEEMLRAPETVSRVRAFDLILNLGVHAHLLEPMVNYEAATTEEEYSGESYMGKKYQLTTQTENKTDSDKEIHTSSAIEYFESWILDILYEVLLLLVQSEENEEPLWASALSCLLYFVCYKGKILRNRLKGLDIRVIKALLEVSRRNAWAEVVHSNLLCMLTNMFYEVLELDSPDTAFSINSRFLIDQLDLVGGLELIFVEYSLATTREERRNLYLVLFDYVLHQVNAACVSAGVSEYTVDEIQPLAALLALADAPEAFYMSVKLGVEGVGELLRRSVSAALPRFQNGERLNMLLENITDKFDASISSFTHLEEGFLHLKKITKSYKLTETIEGLRNEVKMKSMLAWTTLQSLLHSQRISYNQNGYVWLGNLLIAEINEDKDKNIWSSINNLQHKIVHAGAADSLVASDIPVVFHIFCGLLKSKNCQIRWGFLFILEKLLTRCKFLLEENDMQQPSSPEAGNLSDKKCLEKASVVIDIMSSALSLMAQINETDSINILKMCEILLSQLCLKVPYAPASPSVHHSKVLNYMDVNCKASASRFNSSLWDELMDETARRPDYGMNGDLTCETTSMAALLLRRQAIAPMQLVARVPAALFYWPLIQLAGAATDDIALGVAVGSRGRGNHPGATSDIRAALLLLLIGKCTADPNAFQEVGGDEFFRELLDDTDSRVAYYSSAFLLKKMMTENPEAYQNKLQRLIYKAQQSNNEKLLENPYLQMLGIIQLSNEL